MTRILILLTAVALLARGAGGRGHRDSHHVHRLPGHAHRPIDRDRRCPDHVHRDVRPDRLVRVAVPVRRVPGVRRPDQPARRRIRNRRDRTLRVSGGGLLPDPLQGRRIVPRVAAVGVPDRRVAQHHGHMNVLGKLVVRAVFALPKPVKTRVIYFFVMRGKAPPWR
jgi:hypothetical protein